MLHRSQTAWLLHYLRQRCVHVCCRPANILFDEQLNAFLGDTGFAKAAQKSGDRTGATTSVWGGAGSQGYCEDALRTPDEQTEAYSVGVTLLVVLTGHNPVDIEEACCEACEDIDENIRFEDIPAERLAQPNAGWPASVAGELKHCYMQLTNKRRTKRLTLAKLLQSLRALLETGWLGAGGDRGGGHSRNGRAAEVHAALAAGAPDAPCCGGHAPDGCGRGVRSGIGAAECGRGVRHRHAPAQRALPLEGCRRAA